TAGSSRPAQRHTAGSLRPARRQMVRRPQVWLAARQFELRAPRSPLTASLGDMPDTSGSDAVAPNRAVKAVIPAAGLATRFLPATKAVPKELLPLIDRPVLPY